MMPTKAVFFDRDGVLNADTEFPYLPKHIQWTEGAFDAVRAANMAGYKVFVVTNQAGVARGIYTERHVRDLHKWMTMQFKLNHAVVDGFAYCPHHPTEGEGLYLKDCECRKPKPGMIKGFIASHAIDPAQSFLIGDRDTDLQAAEAAGVKGYLFKGGNLADMVKQILSR